MVSKNIVLERIKLNLVTVIVFQSLFLFNTYVVLNSYICYNNQRFTAKVGSLRTTEVHYQ